MIDTLAGGAAVDAVARDAGGRVGPDQPAGRQSSPAWVSARYLELQGDLKSLPLAAPAGTAAARGLRPAAERAMGRRATGKLAFQDHSGGSIYIYDFATGAVRKLVDGADPAISRDGTKVAFWRDTGRTRAACHRQPMAAASGRS